MEVDDQLKLYHDNLVTLSAALRAAGGDPVVIFGSNYTIDTFLATLAKNHIRLNPSYEG